MTVNVEAKVNSVGQGTGAPAGTYKAGQVINITCPPSATWNLNTASRRWTTDANGRPNTPLPIDNEEQVFQAGALVGSFDGGKTFFSVGLRSTISVSVYSKDLKPSELTLYCWDSYEGDNAGTIPAEIEVEG